ncbi:MAG: SxtJ family membrane protein [Rhodothermaceae bacterium]|nr:SxtJ family membrane protein [Rhodothermaceae bacterium]
MTREKQLETILVVSTALLLFFLIFNVSWLLYSAFALSLLALISRSFSYWFTRGWLGFSEILGFVMSRLIMTLLYFLVLTPIALLYRAFNKDPLQLNHNRNRSGSYYTHRGHIYTAKDLNNTW